MGHLGRELVDRLVGGQAGEAETERLVQHALGCASCRTLVANAFDATGRPPYRKVGTLIPTLLHLADSEREQSVETLLAVAEWSALRQLSRKAQQERVALKSTTFHTMAFVNVLLAEVRLASSGDQAEFIASLAVEAVNVMDATKHHQLKEDLKAQALIEVANLRRREARWQRAEVTLSQAKRLLIKGTGDPYVAARFRSVKASLRSDQGRRMEAVTDLQHCKRLYAEVGDLPLIARTLVKEADATYEVEPERALEAITLALPLIREEEVFLYAEILRGWCYLGLDRLPSALRLFSRTEERWAASPQQRVRLRSRFFAGRLLEALGKPREAVRLYEDVIAGDLQHEFYKDTFLDLLYVFGFYFRSGDPERATAICHRALKELAALDLVHEQLNAVWNQLLVAAKGRPLDDRELFEVREYLRVFWNHPAPQPPRFSFFAQDRVIVDHSDGAALPAPLQVTTSEHERPVETLLATAEWSALRQLSRKAQQKHVVVKSRICRSPTFVNLLLSELRSARADEAEYIASLAVRAVNLMDEVKHSRLRADLQARVWTELANLRRREAEWRLAEDALSRAQRLLSKGTGAPSVEARFLSVKASLRSDQGRRSEAVADLQHCKRLYAEGGDWPLVGRTLVKEADATYEVKPERALETITLALPLIREEDVFLYAEILRGWCYIGLNRLPSALQVFRQTQERWTASPNGRVRLRSRFFAGRLLEALDKPREAVRVFEEVVAENLRHGFSKDALLDLLYLFGLHIRRGDAESGIAVCNWALDQMEALDLGHEQLRLVWTQLMEAARLKALDDQVLLKVKEYLQVSWKHPAPQAPKFINRASANGDLGPET